MAPHHSTQTLDTSTSLNLYKNIAASFLKAIKAKDLDTYEHCLRVHQYATATGRKLELDQKTLFELEIAAVLHDIGKLGVPDRILNKPTRLCDEEFRLIKTHPQQSFDILKEIHGFYNIALSIRHHHERYDGKGYPNALQGEHIPLLSRIIAICDTFDCMTARTIHQLPLSFDKAVKELKSLSGGQLDKNLLEDFFQVLTEQSYKNIHFQTEESLNHDSVA
ncbi:MAG: phosphohydrolase [Halobacteriovoraceae bacterium]|nr:phosphohydrolase [Halobacteriovoraceae bacterium]